MAKAVHSVHGCNQVLQVLGLVNRAAHDTLAWNAEPFAAVWRTVVAQPAEPLLASFCG